MFAIPPNIKIVLGLGTAVVAAVTAYEASQEGIERTEDKINYAVDKIKNRKNASAELPE